MSLIRYSTPRLSNWSVFNRLTDLQDEFSRLFDFAAPSREGSLSTGWTPALDLHDAEESFVATVELPGLKKEDIELSLHDGVLTVSGERKHEAKEGDDKSFRSERFFGKFQRSVTLPARVDGSKVSATYQDGILTVTLPKAEEAKPRRIEVGLS